MGDYEELVELGFEGVDKVVDKYHDKAYDRVGKHSASWHRRHSRSQQQRQSKDSQKTPAEISSCVSSNAFEDRRDIGTGSDMYAPERRQERDYQDRRDSRYLSDETYYYRGPDAGAVVMRGSEPYNNARAYELQHFQQPQNDNRRPQPQRRRSSWSPQRSGRDRGRNRRAHSGSRSRSRSKDKQHRIAATVAGGLIGGIIGNQFQKGKGPGIDNAATIAGAVIGGLGAREASEFWDKRRARREDRDEKREEKYGDSRDRRRDDRDGRRRDRRNDRYDDRYDDRYPDSWNDRREYDKRFGPD